MATSKNAKLQFESGQSFTDYVAMTDSGDHTIFSLGTIWSNKSGYEATVRPNGLVTGRNLITIDSVNDTFNYAAFTAYSAGTLYPVIAGDTTITRPESDVAQVFSITMTDGGVLAVVDGVESLSTAFATTRGEAGAPPEILADSVEIGQIRVVANTPAAILATEIFQVLGTHVERFDYPVWEENNIGDGDKADTAAEKNSHIVLADALDPIHASATYKKVYVSYYTPVFAQVTKALDFTPAENSHSVTSTQFYDGVAGASSSTLGQGSFTALMDDNITDSLIGNKDENLTFRFYPDKNKAAYVLTQGILGMGRTFPVADQNQAACTISAETASADFAS